MQHRIGSIAIAASVLLGPCRMAAAGETAAGEAGMVMIPGAAAVTWSPAPADLPEGTEISMLVGDPDKPGPFVLRLKIPPRTVIAPHTHSRAESVTILSGTLDHAVGETLDTSRGHSLTAGGFVFFPENTPHSLWTSSQAAQIEVSGTGPLGLTYIDSARDPAKTPNPAR